MTEVLSVDPESPDPATIARAAEVIRRGGLVAFPTETVYGLGANAFDDAAVGRIFAAKERDPSDPVIVHLAEPADVSLAARAIPPLALALAERFWPGPLTLVLPRAERITPRVSAGLSTVAVRVPAHPVAHALIRAAGVPVAAPSANRFGRTSATTAAHVLADLAGRIDLVLDGGPSPHGVESTVVAFENGEAVVLRPGALTLEALAAALAELGAPPPAVRRRGPSSGSPGLLERHYAPRSPLVLVRGPAERVRAWLREALDARPDTPVGLLLFDEDAAALQPLRPCHRFVSLGGRSDLAGAARRLFAALRELDADAPAAIYAVEPEQKGLGLAIADRLRRAAEEVVDLGADG
ncbi:Threonylcarbamoyl-AMP synthase [bacterium HR29]|nr:Threonylcarbamoyl-AMP synthase [bacterium HR29]